MRPSDKRALSAWHTGIQSERRSDYPKPVPWYHEQKNVDDRRALVRALRDHGWTSSAIALVTRYSEHTVTNYRWFPSSVGEPGGRVLEALTELLRARGWMAYGPGNRPTGVDVSIEGAVRDAVRRGAGHPIGCRPIASVEEYASVAAKLNVDVDPADRLDAAILMLERCPAEALLAVRDFLVVALREAANSVRASTIEAAEDKAGR